MANAQRAALEGDLNVDVLVNYGGDYRNNTWVPVDVPVSNEDRDIKGWAEVRLFRGNQLLSPTYRMPIESPKGSKKRFRLYCKISGVDRVEANLYNGNRAVLDFPPSTRTTPVDRGHLFGMVLNEEVSDFGFVRTILSESGTEFNSFYRQHFYDDVLSSLPDRPQCYSAYDIMLISDIDPSRIGQRQRTLIEQFVREGGLVVIMTGANAAKQRRTWLADLGGVTIGAQTMISERALAQDLFTGADLEGLREDRQIPIAALTPTDPAILVKGNDQTLATLRPLGRGYVATFAIDAANRGLQRCAGYRSLWLDLCMYSKAPDNLDFASTGFFLSTRLPYMAGIQLFSKGSVMLYLALYVGMGIVANWLIFNRLKRRELAWVVLVVFSIAFTSYAMIFGTAGRAKASELEQIEVIRIAEGAAQGNVHSFLGILTARTARYAVNAGEGHVLAEDVSTMSAGQLGQGYGALDSRPFRHVKDSENAIQNLQIGASELRLIKLEKWQDFEGAIDGRLTRDSEGLHGTLVNNTGIPFTDAHILIDGKFYPCELDGTAITPKRWPGLQAVMADNNYYGYRYQPASSTVGGVRSLAERQSFRQQILGKLLYGEGMVGGEDSPSFKPLLLASVMASPINTITLDREADVNIAETIVVADIGVEQVGELPKEWVDLQARNLETHFTLTGIPLSNEVLVVTPPHPNQRTDTYGTVRALLPGWFTDGGGGELRIDLYVESRADTETITLMIDGEDSWNIVPEILPVKKDGVEKFRMSYLIKNWQDHAYLPGTTEYQEEMRFLYDRYGRGRPGLRSEGAVLPMYVQREANTRPIIVHVRAERTRSNTREQELWQ
jgi:hypothetical protein